MKKQKKNTGALVVSLLLTIVLLGMNAANLISWGVLFYKAYTGETSTEVAAPQDAPIAQEPSVQDDVQTEPVEMSPSEIRVENYAEDGSKYGKIEGIFPDGRTWIYMSDFYPEGEQDCIMQVLWLEDMYVFCEGGSLRMLDPYTGILLWTHADFGGYASCATIGAQNRMYFTCEDGPDLYVIDPDGTVVRKVDVLDERYSQPTDMDLEPDGTVHITYSMGPDGEGNYVVIYDMNTDTITAPEALEEQPAASLAWIDAYREVLQSITDDSYTAFALIYLDEDDVPEMYAVGSDAMLLYYDEAQESVKSMAVTEGFAYYPTFGVINILSFGENTSEEAFYSYEKGRLEYIGTAKMRHYEEGSPDCWWNDEKMDTHDFFMRIESFLPQSRMECYPMPYRKERVLKQLECWHDPERNDEWNWKREYLQKTGIRMESTTEYALADVDGNGVPELFQRYPVSGDGSLHVGMWMYNAQTQQSVYQYIGQNVVYQPGSGRLGTTYQYEDYYSDEVFAVDDRNIVHIAYGDRNAYQGRMSYYLEQGEVSEEEYAAYMQPILDDTALELDGQFISTEAMAEQLSR